MPKTQGIDWGQRLGEMGDEVDVSPDLILRVDSVTGDNNLNSAGESWNRAFATIQAAVNRARYLVGTTTIDDAKNHRSRVLVAPGHYNEQILFSGYGIDVIGLGGVPGKDYGVSINYDAAIVAAPSVVAWSGSANSLKNLHIHQAAAYPALYNAGGDNNLLENIVIEGDGAVCTYGVVMDSMKGSFIKNLVITGFITAGIHVTGGTDQYFIFGSIKDCMLFSAAANVTGILVDSQASLVAYGATIERNRVILSNGASCKGIDVNNTGAVVVCENIVSVPASATPIEHAGGDQFLINNHTAAGTVNVDPMPAAG